MPDLQGFIQEFSGRNDVGDTPQNIGQCVGLIEVWDDRLGQPHVWGNACDLLTNADRNAFTTTNNTPENFPGAGDIICWEAGWAGSSVGHTAIVVEANVDTFTVFEQNDRIGGGNGSCRLHLFQNYAGVQGWIHPKALNVPAPFIPEPASPPIAPAPEPAPVVTPAAQPEIPASIQTVAIPVIDPEPKVVDPSSPPTVMPLTAKPNIFQLIVNLIKEFLLWLHS